MSRDIVAAKTEDLFANGDDYFNGYVNAGLFEMMDCPETMVRNRMLFDKDMAEKNPRLKQIIPYVIVVCPEDGVVLAYRRSHGGGETRLRNKFSLGVGGHIEESDIADTLQVTIWKAALREIKEELTLQDLTQDDIEDGLEHIGYVNEDASEVGRVHFGHVMIFRISKETKDTQIKFAEEENLEELRWLTIPELTAIDDSDFELWSQLIRPALLHDAD